MPADTGYKPPGHLKHMIVTARALEPLAGHVFLMAEDNGFGPFRIEGKVPSPHLLRIHTKREHHQAKQYCKDHCFLHSVLLSNRATEMDSLHKRRFIVPDSPELFQWKKDERSLRPRAEAEAALEVANAWKPSPARMRAEPASHGFGITNA